MRRSKLSRAETPIIRLITQTSIVLHIDGGAATIAPVIFF